MRTFAALLGVCGAVGPVAKVVELLHGMEKQIKAEGDAEASQFKDFGKWVTKESFNTQKSNEFNGIKVDEYSAQVASNSADVEQLAGEIAELLASQAQNEKDRAAYLNTRAEQNAEFKKGSAELEETIDTLSRAIRILQRTDNSVAARAAMMQLATGLSAVMNAAFVSSENKNRLAALLSQGEEAEDLPSGTPAAAAYDSHSGSILDLLAELKETAEGELRDARKEEMERKHENEMIVQSLDDQISQAKKSIAQKSASSEELKESLGDARRNLAETKKALADGQKYHKDLMQQSDNKTNESDARIKARAEELAVIDQAVQILSGNAPHAFLQVAARDSSDVREKISALLQGAANRLHSAGLAQLAMRTRVGEDPFSKIKGLIGGMIAKLQDQAAKESDKNAYCVEQKKKNVANRDVTQAKLDKYQTRIEKAEAHIAELTSDVNTLTSEVADITASNAEAQALRNQENAEFNTFKKDTEKAISELSGAINVLSEYYGSSAAFTQEPTYGGPIFEGSYQKKGDSATGVLGMLEVELEKQETDLSARELQEAGDAKAFNRMKQDAEVTLAEKNVAIKGKKTEIAGLTNRLEDVTSDRDGAQRELDSILDFLSKLRDQCVHKVMSFEERAARRQAEIKSLQGAMDILQNETATSLLQKSRA